MYVYDDDDEEETGEEDDVEDDSASDLADEENEDEDSEDGNVRTVTDRGSVNSRASAQRSVPSVMESSGLSPE